MFSDDLIERRHLHIGEHVAELGNCFFGSSRRRSFDAELILDTTTIFLKGFKIDGGSRNLRARLPNEDTLKGVLRVCIDEVATRKQELPPHVAQYLARSLNVDRLPSLVVVRFSGQEITAENVVGFRRIPSALMYQHIVQCRLNAAPA